MHEEDRLQSPRDDASAFRRMERATLEERRRRFRETTMAERLESALELSELAHELRTGRRVTA